MSLRPATIIVVDDEEVLLKNIASELCRHGFHPTHTHRYVSLQERNQFTLEHVTVVLTGSFDHAAAAVQESDRLKAVFVDWYIKPSRFTVAAHLALSNDALSYTIGTGVEIADRALSKHGDDILKYGIEGELAIFCISGIGGKMIHQVNQRSAGIIGSSLVMPLQKKGRLITRVLLSQIEECGLAIDFVEKPDPLPEDAKRYRFIVGPRRGYMGSSHALS